MKQCLTVLLFVYVAVSELLCWVDPEQRCALLAAADNLLRMGCVDEKQAQLVVEALKRREMTHRRLRVALVERLLEQKLGSLEQVEE